jgi:hypothetical protein
VIENQWASHPSHEERIAKLRALNITKETDHEPARNLFHNFEQIEEKLTAKLFSRVKYQKGRTDLELVIFQNRI